LNRDPTLEVTALYCSDFSLRDGIDPGFKRTVTWDVDLLQGYPHVFVGRNNDRGAPRGFWSLTCPRLWSEIRSGRYDAVWLHGHNYAASIIAFVATLSKRLPVLMSSDTHLRLQKPAWRRGARNRVLSVVYRYADAFLAIGSANRAYYRALGVPDNRIFTAPFAVDNARFIAGSTVTPAERQAIRCRYGLPPESLVVLFASKLTRLKHPETVIRAADGIRAAGKTVTVLMVGSGEMETELRILAESSQTTIVFAGFVNQRELPQVYAASDIFVLPAENESWGLVVNEAMCAALPVVVSDQMGCAADLVRHGVNGYLVPPGDVNAVAAALERLLVDDTARKQMGAAGRAIISRWSYEECSRGVSAAVLALVR
jgi:glycosyltransferase involved in cell wall biosynthesis